MVTNVLLPKMSQGSLTTTYCPDVINTECFFTFAPIMRYLVSSDIVREQIGLIYSVLEVIAVLNSISCLQALSLRPTCVTVHPCLPPSLSPGVPQSASPPAHVVSVLHLPSAGPPLALRNMTSSRAETRAR